MPSSLAPLESLYNY